jgi:hypothetical protein
MKYKHYKILAKIFEIFGRMKMRIILKRKKKTIKRKKVLFLIGLI